MSGARPGATHLKSAFRKLEIGRQSELVRLLARLSA